MLGGRAQKEVFKYEKMGQLGAEAVRCHVCDRYSGCKNPMRKHTDTPSDVIKRNLEWIMATPITMPAHVAALLALM